MSIIDSRCVSGGPTLMIDATCEPTLAEVEKQVIVERLRAFGGHRVRTASSLGIGVRTLGMKLRSWGMNRNRREERDSE